LIVEALLRMGNQRAPDLVVVLLFYKNLKGVAYAREKDTNR